MDYDFLFLFCKSWLSLLPFSETWMSTWFGEIMHREDWATLMLWCWTCLQCIFESTGHSLEDVGMGKIDNLHSNLFMMIIIEMHLGMNGLIFKFSLFGMDNIAEVRVVGRIRFGFKLLLVKLALDVLLFVFKFGLTGIKTLHLGLEATKLEVHFSLSAAFIIDLSADTVELMLEMSEFQAEE